MRDTKERIPDDTLAVMSPITASFLPQESVAP